MSKETSQTLEKQMIIYLRRIFLVIGIFIALISAMGGVGSIEATRIGDFSFILLSIIGSLLSIAFLLSGALLYTIIEEK